MLLLILLAFAAGYNHFFLLSLTCRDRSEGIHAHTSHQRIRKAVERSPVTLYVQFPQKVLSTEFIFEEFIIYIIQHESKKKMGKTIKATALCIASTII